MKKTIFSLIGIMAILLVSCATTGPQRGGAPPEIRSWQNANRGTIHGMGISTLANESHALRQATAIARSDLAAAMETRVATVAQDSVRFAQAQGMEDDVVRFEENTMQLINETLNNVIRVGPYMNNLGNTYVILHINTQQFERSVHQIVDEVFERTDNILMQMHGLN